MALLCPEVRDELRRRVDRDIRGFEDWYRLAKGRLYLQAEEEAVLRALHLEPGMTAIDAGCGGGRFTLLLAARAALVRAVDFSPVAVQTTLERARALGLGNVCGEVADVIEGLSGPPAHRVLCSQTLQHIPTHALRLRAVRSLSAAILRGGRLTVSTFNGQRLMDRLRRRRREYTDVGQSWYYYYRFLASELGSLLEEAGLGGVTVRAALNLPGRVYTWPGAAWLRPLDRWLEGSPLGRGLGIYLVASGRKV